MAAYFLAFSPPRLLLDRWRRAERLDYLSRVAELDPEERGRRAAGDLLQTAVRSIGGMTTIVAIRRATSATDFTIAAATDQALAGTVLSPGAGLVGRVLGGRRPLAGTPADCEPDLRAHLTSAAVQVLVAPIAGAQTWGIVIAALRRGALFPEDDLAMLAQLGHDAATTLDHAQLIEERRRRAQQVADRRLREIETRISLMIDSIKDYAMLVLDANGCVAGWHIGAQQLFGYSPAEIDDQPAAKVYDLEPAEFLAWLEEARLRGFAEREGTCCRFDGSTFIGTTIIRPLDNESDEPPGFVAVTKDITEQRRLEERLRQGQKMEAIGQLAGGVAHDFNNLLTAILGYAEWLDRDLVGDPRRGQVLEIERAAERAADLTRQLLAFSRREMLRPSTIDLSQLVSDLLPMVRRLIGEHIEIVNATSAPVSAVLGDRSQVEQVVLNLLVNARDAMPQGGRILIRTADVWLKDSSPTGLPAGPYVVLEVSDSGIGMDAATRERIFEPFFTTKDVGSGTGLGLSTVYGIVTQMGGAVDVESEPQHGATFRLYFPQTSPALAAAPAASAGAPSAGEETVLLVEDDDAVRAYLTHVLEGHGYRVLSAEHHAAATSLMQTFGDRVQLVISDMVMPDGTGPELVERLVRARPGLSALYISGHAETAIAAHADAVKPEDLLFKPFSSTELLTKIRQILSAA